MYIRTKNMIYKVESETFDKQGYYIDEYEYDMILKRQVIKQADTIEELCDEFVVWLNENNCHFTTTNYLYIYQNRDKAKAVFGAIWCEWGLKYVSKMNDKGDLELI